ncbi:periplasmic TRAP-type dicarboxylate transporter protein [Desulforapulum autotrophicum HRM2]|uniref:Periplasmic TRAP-type dicarboxylate transporter protein n=1 Tax=Desulforapulum autotrophicum (strain ATCC 43914 / DSM 3382 / VKM B-1955 / HRM2) TaxID=177437 RepID=C0Q9E2_DESAH|nr:TRAP transporter substrate-binding protein DctP [Desulforapulum autotrophicum]ACN14506.1 periplasmic TRAP-type dicarboxylate transporter protein [Desulforapulum autotrophicum HRM2]
MKLRTSIFVVTTFFLLTMAGSALGADKIVWKMASSWPKGTVLQEIADDFAARITTMSNGRLTIKSYPAGVLMGALEVTDAARMGTIDAAHSSPTYSVGQLPAAPLFGYIPFGMETIPYLTWMYEGEGKALFSKLYEKFDFGYVAPCGIIPSEDLAWSNKPITTMEDFKGLKFRTSGYWGEILSAAGASVMMLPAGEVYEALQRNVLDAGEFSIPSIDKDLAFYEIADYLLVPGIHQTSTFLDIKINKRSWNKLSEDLKEIVRVASEASTMRLLTRCISRDVPALEFFREKGVKIQYLDPKIQKELSIKAEALMAQKAATDPFFKEVWESQKKFRTEYDSYKKLMTPSY